MEITKLGKNGWVKIIVMIKTWKTGKGTTIYVTI